MRTEPCPGCGAHFAPYDGPVHRYIGASPACWALYGAVLAGTAPDAVLLDNSFVSAEAVTQPALDAPSAFASLLVDAYAAQHHGIPSPPAIQSVAVHLLVLHAVLRVGVAADQALWVRRRALRTRGVFTWLTPPPAGAALSVRHLFPGGGVSRVRSADDYVRSVHLVWDALHGAQLSAWYSSYVL